MSRRPVPALAACAISACHSAAAPAWSWRACRPCWSSAPASRYPAPSPAGTAASPATPPSPPAQAQASPVSVAPSRPGGERSVRPVLPAGGGWRSGQAAGRGLLQQAGRQRPGVAEPGGVHRRGQDRPAARVAARVGVAAQQPRDPGQVLGDLPVRAGRGHGGGQHRVAAPGRLGQLGGGEPGRHVHEPAAVIGADRGRVIQRKLVQPGEHPPGQPGRVARAAPGADRGYVGVPLPGPDGRHDQVAVLVEQVVQAVQRGRAVVRVRVPAQLAEPQHGPGRDARLEPRGQRRRGPRVLQRPLRQQLGDRLPCGPGGAGAGLAADHHQSAGRATGGANITRSRSSCGRRTYAGSGPPPATGCTPSSAGVHCPARRASSLMTPIVRPVPSPDGGTAGHETVTAPGQPRRHRQVGSSEAIERVQSRRMGWRPPGTLGGGGIIAVWRRGMDVSLW